MAGFLKKMFSFGKKEVVEKPAETPGLRTGGEELAPINWAALRDLTREEEAEKLADEEAATAKAADEAAAKAAEEQTARELAEAASKTAEADAMRLAEAEAAELRAAQDAISQAAERAAREAEEAARAKAIEAERLAKAKAQEAERLAKELVDKERRLAELAAAEAAQRAAIEARAAETPRFPEPPAPELPDETPQTPDLPVDLPPENPAFDDEPQPAVPREMPIEPDLPSEIPAEPDVPAHPGAPPQQPAPDETPEPELPVEVPAKPVTPAGVPSPTPAKAAPAPSANDAYSTGLITGGDELLAPAWMNYEEPTRQVASPPPPPLSPEDLANKVTVAKKVEQKTAPAAPAPEVRVPWFQRLRRGLLKSSRELSGNIAGVFTKRKLDEDTLQDLEDVLLRADFGLETAMRVTDTLSATRYGREISDLEVRTVMGAEIEKVLRPVALPLELDLSHKPHVILVVGVNGTGKTTTIGKLAAKLKEGGLDVMLAAGDTFRAAAIEQLKIWGERTGSPVVSSKLGADAAGLAYDAFEKAKEAGSDVLIIDTAGRLQNKTELMAELEKIVRVLGKLDPEAPHTVLQTVDATTGQNALNQVEIFRNVAGVNGLVMTKLDGTARGGILVAIAAKHKLPVYFIGVGEQIDDLEPFVAGDFAKAIAGVG